MPDNNEQMHLSVKELWQRFHSWFGALSLWVKIVIFLAVAAGVGLLFAQVTPNPAGNPNVELSLRPASGRYSFNTAMPLNVMISNPSQQPLYAAEVVITYDPTMLDIRKDDCEASGLQDACISAADPFTQVTVQDIIPGVLTDRNTIHIVRGAPKGVFDDATFVTLIFRTRTTPGVTEVNFDQNNPDAAIRNHVVYVAPNGGVADVLAPNGLHGGTYTIGLRTCIDPPPSGWGGYFCNPALMVCQDGLNIGDPCTTSAGCPLALFGHCRDVNGGGSGDECVVNDPAHNGCYSGHGLSETCRADVGCNITTGKCVYDATVTCVDDLGCQHYAACSTASICIEGEEVPDVDAAGAATTDVCCTKPCSSIVPKQLYIHHVISETSAPAEETITWVTYPETFMPSVCTTTLTPGGLSQISTGNPISHKVVFPGLNAGGTYSFHITCNVTGFVQAEYNGQFIVSGSTAETLRIVDAGISDVTCRSFRVTYGTTKPARGTVSWQNIPWGLGSCRVTAPEGSRTDEVYTLSHAVVATPLSPTTGRCSKSPFDSCSSNIDCAAPAQCLFSYCVNITAQIANPPETAGPKYWRVTVPACPAIEPDANQIMKVTRDRVCKNWLYCQSAVRLKNQQGKYEDMCFDLGVCDTLDPKGECANPVALEGATGRANLTFDTPSQIHFIKDVSGYSKVGLAWSIGYCSITTTRECSATNACPAADGVCIYPRVDGLYPYVRMNEVGRTVKVQNGNFETGAPSPWQPRYGASIYVERKSGYAFYSTFILKVVPGAEHWSGAFIPLGTFISAPGMDTMMLTFRARTDKNEGHCERTKTRLCDISADCPIFHDEREECVLRAIRAQLAIGNDYHNFVIGKGAQKVTLDNSWVTYQMRLGTKAEDGKLPENLSGQAFLQFVQQESSAIAPSPFYIDDVTIQPALAIAEGRTLPRSCRTYPTQDAPACDFLEAASGKEYKGWKGYCVERQDPNPSRYLDPANDCLIWWPVDVLLGTSDLFSSEPVAGYTGRKPLYYCLESKGDWPYYDRAITSDTYGQCQSESCSFPIDLSWLDIYKNEIIEVRIDDIQMDDGTSDSYDCTMRNDDTDINLSLSGKKGTIILNQSNKDHWRNGLTSTKNCGPDDDKDKYHALYNPYAYLRCEKGAHENDCNMISAWLEFGENNKLKILHVYYKDGSGGSGRVKFKGIITYRGERCNVIAQVVTQDGETLPYATRIGPGGFKSPYNAPKYPYEQDYEPYGGLVLPRGSGIDPGDPATWPGPAYVEAPITQGQTAPYQYRAGAPYGIRAVKKVCSAGNVGAECEEDEDCNYAGACAKGPDIDGYAAYYCSNNGSIECNPNDEIAIKVKCAISGICSGVSGTEGGRVCITGSDEKVGKLCDEETNCGYVKGDVGAPGICAGVDKPKEMKNWENFYTALDGGAERGKGTLRELFAKAYSVWAFNPQTGRYGYCCTPGTTAGCVGRVSDRCVDAWDILDGTDPDALKIAAQPRVKQIWIDGLLKMFKRAGGVALKFTSSVDEDHKPLTSYRVDWRDGSQITSVEGLRIEPKQSSQDPHIVTHTYQCGVGGKQIGPEGEYDLPVCGAGGVNCWDGTYCLFKPYVQVMDNWGLCNGSCENPPGTAVACAGSMCATPAASPLPNPQVWKAYGGVIRVRP
ncbi:MAG: hypothetical protein WC659_04565 [Patescibacteria group bacterium]